MSERKSSWLVIGRCGRDVLIEPVSALSCDDAIAQAGAVWAELGYTHGRAVYAAPGRIGENRIQTIDAPVEKLRK